MTEDRLTESGHDSAGHEKILDQVGVAVITIDSDGFILNTNASAALMFGHKESAMQGQNVSILMPGHHARKHDDYLHHHMTTGERRIIGKGRMVEGKRADGSVFPMHLAVGRLEVDDAVLFKGIIHDLSVQGQLQDQATRLGQIVDESINEIYVFRTDSLRFTLANRGALKNLGYSSAELLRITPVDIKPEFTDISFRELLRPLLIGELERISFQTVHRRKDGSEYDADVVLHLSDAVSPPEFVAIVQDSTEKNNMLKAVSQSQKMESIGQLTGGIAHDFNNLLTIISGNLELLDMVLTESDQLDLVSEALSASARGADLTHRLLSFARRSRLVPEKVNLNNVILELSELLKRSLGEGVCIELNLASSLWDVKVDRSQIDSALMNLAINARDAMSGKGTLTLITVNQSLSATDAELVGLVAGNYAVLSVCDTGSGIASNEIERVFEPFYTTKSKSRGHGLGLSMVYGFAKQSGGSVSVESNVGSGTSFSIYLPQKGLVDTDVKTRAPVMASTSAAGHTILVVDDDDSVRRLCIRRLKQMGYDVLEARNTAEALELVQGGASFHMLITDIVMPGDIDGLGLAKHLRSEDPYLPIIVCSGYSKKLLALDEESRKEFLLLPKPYSLEELRNTVSAALL